MCLLKQHPGVEQGKGYVYVWLEKGFKYVLVFLSRDQITSISGIIGKDPNAGKDWGQEKGTTEDEVAGWHHQLDGHGFG